MQKLMQSLVCRILKSGYCVSVITKSTGITFYKVGSVRRFPISCRLTSSGVTRGPEAWWECSSATVQLECHGNVAVPGECGSVTVPWDVTRENSRKHAERKTEEELDWRSERRLIKEECDHNSSTQYWYRSYKVEDGGAWAAEALYGVAKTLILKPPRIKSCAPPKTVNSLCTPVCT